MNSFLHIHSPWWGLLAVVILLGIIVAWHRRRPALRVSTLQPYSTAGGRQGRKKPLILRIPLLLYGAGLLSLVIALCRPQIGIERTIRRTEGIDIMLAVDVSGSMKAYDLGDEYQTSEDVLRGLRTGKLQSRIEIARQELIRFVENRPHDRIGLVVFSKYPYVVCPPTLDQDFLLKNMERIDISAFPDMTGIAGPITSAVNRLQNSDARRRVLVLFTDGDNNVNAAVTPIQAARLAETFDIIIYTVGIGSRRSVLAVDTPWGTRLRGGVAGFNQDLLQTIAETTGGRYFEARDADRFRQVMQEIDKLEKVTIEQPLYLDYRERFLPWLIAGIALCLIAFLLQDTVLQELP